MGKNPFENITYDDFRRLAKDESLSKYEKIGFPDSYRAGYEEQIFQDIRLKLTRLDDHELSVVDIGPGCSDLPRMLIRHCADRRHSLTVIDSAEMLSLLPDAPYVEKVAALYPNCPELIQRLQNSVDVILCYSVLHYVFVDVPIFAFLDASLSMLAPGGAMLIGDIPNISKRKRFFSSEAGIRFHQEFMNEPSAPEVAFNRIERNQIDDSVIFALVQRARAQGFDAYVVPQCDVLPMANRREDILIVRP